MYAQFSDAPIEPIDFDALRREAAEKKFAEESQRITGEYMEGLISEEVAKQQYEEAVIENRRAHGNT